MLSIQCNTMLRFVSKNQHTAAALMPFEPPLTRHPLCYTTRGALCCHAFMLVASSAFEISPVASRLLKLREDYPSLDSIHGLHSGQLQHPSHLSCLNLPQARKRHSRLDRPPSDRVFSAGREHVQGSAWCFALFYRWLGCWRTLPRWPPLMKCALATGPPGSVALMKYGRKWRPRFPAGKYHMLCTFLILH